MKLDHDLAGRGSGCIKIFDFQAFRSAKGTENDSFHETHAISILARTQQAFHSATWLGNRFAVDEHLTAVRLFQARDAFCESITNASTEIK
jgi:hypothetical protein